jgi:hypothetical protein
MVGTNCLGWAARIGPGSPLTGEPNTVSETSARYGWQSDFPAFVQASPEAIEAALLQFLQAASSQQTTSWYDSIRWLQRAYDCCVREEPAAERYFTMLEYEMPRDFLCPDILEGITVSVPGVHRYAMVAPIALSGHRDIWGMECRGDPLSDVRAQ